MTTPQSILTTADSLHSQLHISDQNPEKLWPQKTDEALTTDRELAQEVEPLAVEAAP